VDHLINKKLDGKVALITGGARGLGKGYALRLAELGADIAIIDRNLESFKVYEFERKLMTASTVMDECEVLGVNSIGLELDLTDRKATTKAVNHIVHEMGKIDIIICNAGGGTTKFADELSIGAKDLVTTSTPSDCPQDTLMRVLNNNLMTCIYTCLAVVPYMKKQKSGKIVTVASSAGIVASGRYFPYGLAKAAIIYYTRTLAKDLGPYNINVNCIAPAIIRTGRLGDRSHLADRIPLRREGTIEDCVKVIEFLVTDLSDYVTGKTITVGGGVCDKQ
jgi:3-oxoacyl-[acyl-carrier protein] reductase